MKASVIIDLVFGDSGKGITTDYLCSQKEDSIVVRFSGGQQAGHGVKIADKFHIHSNYGSGTLRGVPSYFSEYCTMYLSTIVAEKNKLESIEVKPVLYIHPLAKVTTPYDVAYGRVTEKNNLHGSVGLGIGATMSRNINTGYKLYAIDFEYRKLFIQKLYQINEYYEKLLASDGLSLRMYRSFAAELESTFMDAWKSDKLPFTIIDYSILEDYENIIFEGSQGILLDMDHGIFPNVTYANTTSKNAMNICNKLGIAHSDRDIYYLTRCYQTRHGSGWMSNEDKIELTNNQLEINTPNEWQGEMRVGEIDYKLLNHSLEIDKLYCGELPRKNLVVTCLDQRADFILERKFNTKFNTIIGSHSPESKDFKFISKKFALSIED